MTEILEAFVSDGEGWRPYVHWNETRYTRNRIARTDAFELLLLCWGEGQESSIHAHEGKDCWLAVVDGAIEEVQFAFPETGARGPLEPTHSHVLPRGAVGYMHDDIGLHLVRAHGGPGVSLHLYAPPYDACNVYCPDTGEVTRIQLACHSVDGEPV